MKKDADLVAEKKKRIASLQTKKLQTEEAIDKAELDLENIIEKIKENNERLHKLVDEDQEKKDAYNNLGKLIGKNLLVIMVLAITGSTFNLVLYFAIIPYILLYLPKYISLIKSILKRNGFNEEEINALKNEIYSLESDKETLNNLIRKLNYKVDDIESEKKVIEDIILYMTENKTPSYSNGDRKDITRIRVNPIY